jgi:hypothetical protein
MNNAEGLKTLRDAPDFSALKDAILGPAALQSLMSSFSTRTSRASPACWR